MFVTFRLHGSLPANRVFPPARMTTGKAFVAMDRLLDAATTGPRFLAQSEIAEVVMTALWKGDGALQHYALHAFAIMPNHVHVLVTPAVNSSRWIGPLKGVTGHRANEMLGRKNVPFWQDASFEHLVRCDQEFRRILRYIENNPVRAGLAVSPAEFAWSSAHQK